jgi:hypothetical protein
VQKMFRQSQINPPYARGARGHELKLPFDPFP